MTYQWSSTIQNSHSTSRWIRISLPGCPLKEVECHCMNLVSFPEPPVKIKSGCFQGKYLNHTTDGIWCEHHLPPPTLFCEKLTSNREFRIEIRIRTLTESFCYVLWQHFWLSHSLSPARSTSKQLKAKEVTFDGLAARLGVAASEKCMLCNGFVRLRFHRIIQQQYDSYTPQLTSGGLKPGLSGLRDLSASTDFILLNFALAKDTFLLTSSGLRVHVMSASSQISSCINNSSTSSRVIMPTTRYEDNTKLRFVKRNVTRSRPAH